MCEETSRIGEGLRGKCDVKHDPMAELTLLSCQKMSGAEFPFLLLPIGPVPLEAVTVVLWLGAVAVEKPLKRRAMVRLGRRWAEALCFPVFASQTVFRSNCS